MELTLETLYWINIPSLISQMNSHALNGLELADGYRLAKMQHSANCLK